MSLVRLLTTGKSLIGLNGDAIRYEMHSRNLLPKFVSPKNPFANTTSPRVDQPTAAIAVSPGVIQKMSPAEIVAANLKETKRLPAVAAVSARTAEPLKEKTPGRLSRWVEKMNPLGWCNRRPANKSAVPRFNKAPIQVELSLDKIKVVRNDLSETDVEIVPVKTTAVNTRVVTVTPKPEPEPQLAIPDLPPATESWELLGERILAK
jgi:hypothetical protein